MKIALTCKRVLVLSLFTLGAIGSSQLNAQSFKVLYSYTGGKDGGNPLAGFVLDAAGENIYGTTSSGGAYEKGAIVRFNLHGKAVLYSFTGGTDGNTPESSLIFDKAGNLYGTTFYGGTNNAGVVYELNTHGKESVLYSFTGGLDGANPEARLAIDTAGNLYGTTTGGGGYGSGTVFEISGGKETVLYSYGKEYDGDDPVSGVTLDAAGNVYGTTSQGGQYGYGIVFELSPSQSGWTETILHNFQLQADGGTPYGGLTFDNSGNLYGTSTDGGTGSGGGGGTIFELTPSNGSWNFNTIYGLDGWGVSGTFRDILVTASGTIFATTHCDGNYDAGTVYELANSGGTWNYTLLYTFTGGTDGMYSFSNLVQDKRGNLYGTTNQGGAYGDGDVFRVTP